MSDYGCYEMLCKTSNSNNIALKGLSVHGLEDDDNRRDNFVVKLSILLSIIIAFYRLLFLSISIVYFHCLVLSIMLLSF